MKGRNIRLTIAFWAVFLCGALIHLTAQTAVCIDPITVALDYFGNATITAAQVDGGSTGYQTLEVSPSSFDCTNMDFNTVTLTATAANGNISVCTTLIVLVDVVPPVAICNADIYVQVDGNGSATISVADVDDGSYDNCTIDTMYLSQTVFNCSDGPEQTVALHVKDQSGVENQVWATVHLVGALPVNPSGAMVCEAYISITPSPVQPYLLGVNDILEEGPSGCASDYILEVLDENSNLIPGGIIDTSYQGQELTAIATFVPTGIPCFTTVEVIGGSCSAFYICDTEPWTAPTGGCQSGHTLSDNIEWPADITVDDCFYGLGDLAALSYISPNDVEPRFFPDTCDNVAMNYADQVFLISGDTSKVIRDWTVINWLTFGIWSYQQIITVNCVGCNSFDICDTEPWDSPIGDCASGHTLSDGIEWPADITISDCYYSPYYLENNTNTSINNVRPQFSPVNCPLVVSAYEDQVFWIDSANLKVHRTWHVLDWISTQAWSYTQIIRVEYDDCLSIVSINTLGAVPVPGVLVAPNIVTNTDGKAELTDPGHNRVSPDFQDNSSDGIDLYDMVLAREYLLSIRSLSPLQEWAADLDSNGEVSGEDLDEYAKTIGNMPGALTNYEWLFVDANANLADLDNVDITNIDVADVFPQDAAFIGVKKGDITGDGYEGMALSQNTRIKYVDLIATDRLINAGELYEVDLTTNVFLDVVGEVLELKFDLTQVEILGISSLVLPGFSDNHYEILPDGTIRIFWLADDALHIGGGVTTNNDTPILSIEMRAKTNGILSKVMAMSETGVSSFARFMDQNRYIFVLKWENEIILTVDPTGLDRKITLAPNPSRAFAQITVSENVVEDYDLRVYDNMGREVYRTLFAKDALLNTSVLENGLYFYTVSSKSGLWHQGKLIVQH